MNCSMCCQPMRKVGEPFKFFKFMAQRWRCDDHRDADELDMVREITLDQSLHQLTCAIKVSE